MSQLNASPAEPKTAPAEETAVEQSAETPVDVKASKKAARAEKKEARKAKKAARKAKKEAKKHSAVLYSPEKMQGFRFSVPIGYLLRFFAIAFSLFGVLWLFCDAFKLTEHISALALLLFCFGAVTAFSLIFIGRWFILAGIGIIGGYIGLLTLVAGNPLTFFISGVEEVINSMMSRLSDAGFAAFGTVNLPYLGGLSYGESREQTLTYGGIFALATVLALIFAAFSAKRTRLLPMLITGGGLCALCFTYNLCETNWGIACVLAGLCSAVVLSSYDKFYKAHKHSKKSRAYSGYSAALAGILALAVLLVPASSMTKPWGEIEFIATPMQEARTLLTTILTGGNPKYNKMNTLTDHRSNDLEEITFDNVVLFEVQSYVGGPVYLRSWIAKDFDYKDNSWNQLSTIDDNEMKRQLKYDQPFFTGDQIAYDRYTLLDSRLTSDSLKENRYVRNSDLGFEATFIDIEYINNSGLLYVLPSSFVTSTGLLEFESRTETYHENFDLHADGMYTSSWFNLFKQYTAAAIMPNYQFTGLSTLPSDWVEGAYNATEYGYGKLTVYMARYFELLFEYAGQASASLDSDEKLITGFRAALDSEGLHEFSTDAFEEYLTMSNAEQTRWFDRYKRLYDEYTAYVYENYTQVPDNSTGINQIYDMLSDSIDAAENDHEKVMKVIDFLNNNYLYTTAPTVSEERKYEHDLDYFLLEGREGYCVQFATAATLLLRKAGIPARYVQGYIATEFDVSSDASGSLNYTADVLDSDAHAWVEVYIDGLGWRTYEATPAYYDWIYYVEPYAPSDPGVTTPPPEVTLPPITQTTEPVTTPSYVTTPPAVSTDAEGAEGEEPTDTSQAIDLAQLGRVLLTLAVVALLIVLVIRRVRQAQKIVDGRNYFIDRAEYGSFEEKADFDQVAGVLCDSIYEVHFIIGNRPKQGELPTEFAARIDRAPIDDSRRAQRVHYRLSMLPSTLSEVTLLIEKQEFGKTMNRTELSVLGSYLRALIASEYPNLPLWKKLWYRYIRSMI